MGAHSNEPLTSLSVRKSNDFISAKYKSSLLENQVMAIALTRIEVNANDKDAPLEARLFPGELKKLVSDPAHIYRDLKKLAKTITGHTMFLEDGKGNFKAFSVVPNADYIDGVFIIKFNNELRDHVLGLEKNYTNLELSVMTDFKKNSSFRLYEVLKKEAYKIPSGEDGCIQVEYNISELRFIIGLANSDDQSVKNAMANMGRLVDWDELYEKLDKKDKKYEEWRDFQRRILKPAQEELEEKSDIRFDYEGLREGRKTKRILFTIYHNVPSNPDIIDERQKIIEANSVPFRQMEMPYDTFPELYDELIGHNNLSKEDIDLLLQKANYDTDRVRAAIGLADEQEEILNYMGWLVRCIENDYTQTATLKGDAKRHEQVTRILEEYDKNIDTIASRAWEKIKNKAEFPQFVEAVEMGGLDIEQMEIIYDAQELTKAFTDWKREWVSILIKEKSMAKNEIATATLLHDAKRCVVYEYGLDGVIDGKITISKRLMADSDIDYIDALDSRDIEIVNCTKAKSAIELAGVVIDSVALSLATSIIDAYQNTKAVPERVSK